MESLLMSTALSPMLTSLSMIALRMWQFLPMPTCGTG
jgi:hypothetical protein